MKKWIGLLLIWLLLSGCGSQIQEQAENGYTFTDDLGREVTVCSSQRTAALLGSYADIWHLAGGSVCAAPDDAWEDFDLPLEDCVTDLGGTKDLSLERLLSSEPDFVLASTNTPQHLQWQQTLEAAHIPVAYFDVSCFEDYLRMLKICTDITGRADCFQTYGVQLQEQISSVLQRSAGKQEQHVLVLRASASNVRAKNSRGTVLGMMLQDFGCINIADSDTSLLETLSVESILLRDPDKIFFIQTGDDMEAVKSRVKELFRENPLWQELTAVREGNVYFMEKRMYNLKPNALWAQAYEELEAIIYETQ